MDDHSLPSITAKKTEESNQESYCSLNSTRSLHKRSEPNASEETIKDEINIREKSSMSIEFITPLKSPTANPRIYNLVYAFPKVTNSWREIKSGSMVKMNGDVSAGRSYAGGQSTQNVHHINQTSIPKARLAFVTEMVENSCHESSSRVMDKYLPLKNSCNVSKEETQKEVQIPKVELGHEECRSTEALFAIAEKSETGTNSERRVNEYFPGIREVQNKVNGMEDRRILSSTEASVDRSSILDNRDKIKDLWEKRMMASEQPISSAVISDSSNDNEEFETMPSKKAENDTCVMVPGGTETEEEKTALLKDISGETEVVETLHNGKEGISGPQEVDVESPVPIICSETAEKTKDVEKNIPNPDQNYPEKEVAAEQEDATQSNFELTEKEEVQDFSDFSAEVSQTSETEQYFKTVATCSLSESNKFHRVADLEFEDFSHLDGEESLHDTSEIQEKDSLEVSIDSDYGEHSEHEGSYLHEEIYDDSVTHDTSDEVEKYVDEDSRKQSPITDGEDVVEKYIKEQKDETPNGEMHDRDPSAEHADVTNALNNSKTQQEKEESNNERNVKRGHKVRPSTLGVQKTEQPYNTCTTETKIAMEIREMREREEELKLMREKLKSPMEGSPSPSSPVGQSTNSHRSTPQSNPASPEPVLSGPGYRVSSVFGHKGAQTPPQPEEERKSHRSFSKESSVEKEIRLARNREEELRREKGLPPREDDSYVKPSQVKSSQVRVFSKASPSNSTKEMATAKIQLEIEEQTMREMTLRDTGRIQTISQERTDSKVAKLKDLDVFVPECTSPSVTTPTSNGNGTFSDQSSKRSTPSPTGSSQGILAPVSRPSSQGKGISMQRFIASRGKETTFSAPRNGPLHPQSEGADASRSNFTKKPAKRVASVESKIQREILEMKLREEELRRLHSATEQSFLTSGENGTDPEVLTNSPLEYENSPIGSENEETCPSHNILIAKWEQRIQKSEGKA